LPRLLPHLKEVLNELPYLRPHLAGIVEHRATLLAALPHLKAHLRYLRPYYAAIASRGNLLAPHATAIAPHLLMLLPKPPFWPDTLLARIDQLSPILSTLPAAPLPLWLPHLDTLVRLEPAGVRAVAANVKAASRRVEHGENQEGKPPTRVGAFSDDGLHSVDAAVVAAAILQVRRPWEAKSELHGDQADAESDTSPETPLEPSAPAAPMVDGKAAVADGFWSAVRRKFTGIDVPVPPVRAGTAASADDSSREGEGAAGGKWEAHLRRRQELSSLIEQTTDALSEAEMRMRRLEIKFREFKHDAAWRAQAEQAQALALSRAEESLITMEESMLGLEGKTAELKRDVGRAALLVGEEEIALARERKLVRSRVPPPMERPASISDVADWLLWKLPL